MKKVLVSVVLMLLFNSLTFSSENTIVESCQFATSDGENSFPVSVTIEKQSTLDSDGQGEKLLFMVKMPEPDSSFSTKIEKVYTDHKGTTNFTELSEDLFTLVKGLDLNKVTSYVVYKGDNEGAEASFMLVYAYEGNTRLAGMAVVGWLPGVCHPHEMIDIDGEYDDSVDE